MGNQQLNGYNLFCILNVQRLDDRGQKCLKYSLAPLGNHGYKRLQGRLQTGLSDF